MYVMFACKTIISDEMKVTYSVEKKKKVTARYSFDIYEIIALFIISLSLRQSLLLNKQRGQDLYSNGTVLIFINKQISPTVRTGNYCSTTTTRVVPIAACWCPCRIGHASSCLSKMQKCQSQPANQ